MKRELPSGAELDITLADFATSKNLYQVVAEEAIGLKIDENADIDVNLYKDLFMIAISSRKVEAAIHECMKKCTYNGVRVVKVSEVFESEEARGDYLEACFEVMVENIRPFLKGLFARLKTRFAEIISSLQ